MCLANLITSIRRILIELLRITQTTLLRPSKFIQRPHTLLEPLVARYPKLLPVLHDICQHGASKEHHVFSSRRVFDFDFKFLVKVNSVKVQRKG